MHLLPIGLESLETLTSDGGRYAMSGVDLALLPDNTFVAQATNGRTALRVSGQCILQDQTENIYPPLAALDSAPNGESASIIPAAEWKAAFTAAKKIKGHKAILKSVACVVGKDVTTLASTNLEKVNFNQAQNVVGRFPNIPKILRKPSEAFATVTLTPSVVVETFSALAKLCPDQTVDVDLFRDKNGKGPICFLGLRANMPAIGGKVEGAMMPCQSPEVKPTVKEADLDQLQERIDQLEQLSGIESMVAYIKEHRPDLVDSLRAALSE